MPQARGIARLSPIIDVGVSSGFPGMPTLLLVPAAQDDRAGVPRVIVQVPVFVGPHDVVHTERPRAPPQRWLVRVAGVGVEQPPTAHVHLVAVGGHDV